MRAVGEVSGAVAPTWHEQYERMLRWLERLSESTTHDDRHLDDFHAFFITCFHLKDWLQEDPAVDTKIRGKVEGFLEQFMASTLRGSRQWVETLRRQQDAPIRFTGTSGEADD